MASGTTGTWGRPYPLSTDAPNVHTDIQALANSLETVPLFPQAKTTSFSAAAGFSYAAGTGVTATLPASPATGDTIRVAGSATVTGAAPATVTAAGGKGINGLGLAAASTFKLGTPWAYAMLQYDGTNWQIIDGQQDTGWVALSLASGFIAGGLAPAARCVGDRVWLCGTVHNNTGGTVAGNTTWATVPVACQPTLDNTYAVVGNPGTGGPIGAFVISASGSPAGALQNNGSVIVNQSMVLDSWGYRRV
jgi:hypothetical protein